MTYIVFVDFTVTFTCHIFCDLTGKGTMTSPTKSLLHDLEELERTRGRESRPCRLQRLLSEDLDDETAMVLRRLVEESDVSVQKIKRHLMGAGLSIGWGTLKQHRDHICTCWIGQDEQ